MRVVVGEIENLGAVEEMPEVLAAFNRKVSRNSKLAKVPALQTRKVLPLAATSAVVSP